MKRMKTMTKMKIWMPGILLLFFFVVSCEKEDPIIEAEVLVEYLESMNSTAGDYVNTDMPAIRSAEQVRTLNTLNKVYIMDIRSATDFADGHIENAVNVAAGDVLNHIESVDLSGYDEVSIVCYTGQTAGWATCLLRLMGYDKVYSMKFGMCSWHADFADRWNNNTKSTYSTQFVSTVTEKGPAGELPLLSTGKETGQEILEVRVDEVLADGFGEASISSTEVYANLDNYYIVNYWPEAEYLDPGHIEGAVQYTPKQSIKLATDLKTLPADKTIVVYCYTGQNSANLAAYLRVLGYEAKSLLFGTNGMIYNDMTVSKWSASQIMGYEYVQ
ncbi:MAG TPA: rhodanese-like domain-containing protein [Bacteroides sp.]|nr:rhodanese-like domain-containing protein [Bacteroides sp.]